VLEIDKDMDEKQHVCTWTCWGGGEEMEKRQGSINEKTIWELYMKECKENRKTPSVEDFKVWTTSLLKGL
jgi:hypothetical protein